MHKKFYELIFFIALITIMVMSLNMAILDSTGMTIKPAVLLCYSLIIVTVAAIIIKYRIALIGVAILTTAGGIYAYAKHIMLPLSLVSEVLDFFVWLPQFIVGYEAFDLKYSIIFSVLYIIFTTLIISLLVFNRRGYWLLIVLGTSAFAFFWFIYVANARRYLFLYLFAALVLYSYNVYDKKRAAWIKNDSSIDKNIEIKWVFNSLIIVFISIIISQFAVIDLKPVQWNWLSEKTLQVFPFIASWRNDNIDSNNFSFGSRYDISRAGYETARLGGPVKLSDSIMITIETNATDNLYLKGRVKDLYTGSSWKKTKKSDIKYNSDSDIGINFPSNISVYKKEIRVTHIYLKTSSIFAPNNLSNVKSEINKYSVDEDGEAYFPRILAKKDSYTVTSEIPYMDISTLRQIDTASLAPDIYKQLPENISDRVKQLSLGITKGYNNDYDKAKAIERFLRQNYKYTLTPSEVPKNAEFVDYFLFEGKEGYCTYFATSMAVLLRASGIPCRYVEGFLGEYDNSYTRNIPGTSAHAWVEVNFGEYGWLVFEATPAYPILGFRAQENVPAQPIPEVVPNNPTTPSTPIIDTGRDKNLEVEEDGASTDISQKKEMSLTMRIILAIIAIILIRILYLLSKRAYIELRIKKASGKHYSIKYFEDLLRYLKKIGLKMDADETMREFWYKVKYTLEEAYKDGDEIIRLIEQARYSTDDITEQQRKQLEEYRKMLKKFVAERLGTVKAFISYYIIGF